jgi:uncharacterized protein YjbJ (UPF0337 family)
MDQVQGFAKGILGKVQEQAGKWFGSPQLRIKGLKKQVSGKLQKNGGDAIQYLKDRS